METDYFDIVAGELQGDTLSPYLFIICLDNLLRISIYLMKENSFKLAKERSRRYPTEIITNAEYAYDRVLQANAPAQAKSLLHYLERASGGIGLHVNADKTEYMCFNQIGNIFTLKDGPLKLVNKFINRDLQRHGQLSIDYQSYGSQTWLIKWNAVFSKQGLCRYCYMDTPHGR